MHCVSSTDDFEIHLKRLPNSCFVNNYNPTILKAWQALFVNSNMPSDHIRIFKTESEINELDKDSTDVFKRSLIDRYMDRSNKSFCKGKYIQVDSMCFALFAAYYHVDYKLYENDLQPEFLTELCSEQNHDTEQKLPKKIQLMSSGETMICHKV